MKSLSVKLGIILFGLLVVFHYAEVWGADWRWYASTPNSDALFYDAGGITRQPDGIVRVSIKRVLSDKSRADSTAMYGKMHKDVDYQISLSELDCRNKMARFLSTKLYSKEGKLISSPGGIDWDYIGPESAAEALFDKLCK